MSEKMKNLWVRTVSGAVLAVVMLGAITWSQWSFGLLLAAMLALACFNIWRKVRRKTRNMY